MAKDGSVDLQELTKLAADIAKTVPEELRAAAFNKVFDALLVQRGDVQAVSAGERRSHPKTDSDPTRGKQDRVAGLLHSLDRTAHPEIGATRTARDAALYLLRAAQKANVEWLSPAEISRVLREKFRHPVQEGAVRMALSGAHAFVDRRSAGRSFEYRLMGPGEKYLDDLATNGGTTQVRASAKRRPPKQAQSKQAQSKKPAPTAGNKKEPKPKRSGTPRGRPGPMALVEALMEEGFFAKHKTIGDIISHAKTNLARTYKPTDLSPTLIRAMHAGKLSRELNAEGQYQYTRRK
jgi:hypothetical protein